MALKDSELFELGLPRRIVGPEVGKAPNTDDPVLIAHRKLVAIDQQDMHGRVTLVAHPTPRRGVGRPRMNKRTPPLPAVASHFPCGSISELKTRPPVDSSNTERFSSISQIETT